MISLTYWCGSKGERAPQWRWHGSVNGSVGSGWVVGLSFDVVANRNRNGLENEIGKRGNQF